MSMSNRRVRQAKAEVKEQVQYALRKGSGIGGISPEIVGTTLTEIHARHGGLAAQIVVDESRPEEAPLHPAFEWRDEVAGELYRHHQARRLIKRVQVIQPDETGQPERVPVFVHVPSDSKAGTGSYEPISVVVQKPDLYLMALSQLLRKVSEATRSVEELKRAAQQSDQPADRMMAVEIAASALQTAQAALASLH
jgi:hypothetical protein